MLMPQESKKIRASLRFGRVLHIRYRTAGEYLPYRSNIAIGTVVADEIDRLIVMCSSDKSIVTIVKDSITIVS